MIEAAIGSGYWSTAFAGIRALPGIAADLPVEDLWKKAADIIVLAMAEKEEWKIGSAASLVSVLPERHRLEPLRATLRNKLVKPTTGLLALGLECSDEGLAADTLDKVAALPAGEWDKPLDIEVFGYSNLMSAAFRRAKVSLISKDIAIELRAARHIAMFSPPLRAILAVHAMTDGAWTKVFTGIETVQKLPPEIQTESLWESAEKFMVRAFGFEKDYIQKKAFGLLPGFPDEVRAGIILKAIKDPKTRAWGLAGLNTLAGSPLFEKVMAEILPKS
jgi:hypothetical protein